MKMFLIFTFYVLIVFCLPRRCDGCLDSLVKAFFQVFNPRVEAGPDRLVHRHPYDDGVMPDYPATAAAAGGGDDDDDDDDGHGNRRTGPVAHRGGRDGRLPMKPPAAEDAWDAADFADGFGLTETPPPVAEDVPTADYVDDAGPTNTPLEDAAPTNTPLGDAGPTNTPLGDAGPKNTPLGVCSCRSSNEVRPRSHGGSVDPGYTHSSRPLSDFIVSMLQTIQLTPRATLKKAKLKSGETRVKANRTTTTQRRLSTRRPTQQPPPFEPAESSKRPHRFRR